METIEIKKSLKIKADESIQYESKRIDFKGRIEVLGTLEFSECEIHSYGTACITVKEGAELTIDNCDVFCEEVTKNTETPFLIVIEDGGSLELSTSRFNDCSRFITYRSNDDGKLFIHDCEFNDCFGDVVHFSSEANNVRIEDSRFTISKAPKNYRAIFSENSTVEGLESLQSYNKSALISSNYCYSLNIANDEFIITDAAKSEIKQLQGGKPIVCFSPFDPDDESGIDVKGCVFDGFDFCINANTIKKCTFRNCSSICTKAERISGCTIENCHNGGIKAAWSGLTSMFYGLLETKAALIQNEDDELKVDNCKFKNCSGGIIYSEADAEISKCVFDKISFSGGNVDYDEEDTDYDAALLFKYSNSNVNIKNCKFNNINIRGGYLIASSEIDEDVWHITVSGCSFSNCSTDAPLGVIETEKTITKSGFFSSKSITIEPIYCTDNIGL